MTVSIEACRRAVTDSRAHVAPRDNSIRSCSPRFAAVRWAFDRLTVRLTPVLFSGSSAKSMFLPLPHLVQVERLHPVPKAIQRLMAVSFEDLALPLQLSVALIIILNRQLVDERVGSGAREGKFLSEIV